MNYEKLYFRLCAYCRDVSVKDRIKVRDESDYRLSIPDEEVYVENHHIIPKHSGGGDNVQNLVYMLPEEHFMAHLIRFKAYGDKNDFLSVRLMVNGYTGKEHLREKIGVNTMNKMVRMFKNRMVHFRKENEWHTEDGRKRISDARKGTMPVIDVYTRVPMGSVSTTHPMVLSGEWVHHSTGMVSARDNITNRVVRITSEEFQDSDGRYSSLRGDISGNKNPNYFELTDEMWDAIFMGMDRFVVEGHIITKLLISYINTEVISKYTNRKKGISQIWLRNHFGGTIGFCEEFNNKYGTDLYYNPYYRCKVRRELARKLINELRKREK